MFSYDHTDIFLELDANYDLWPLIRTLQKGDLSSSDQQALADRLIPSCSKVPHFVFKRGKRGRPRKLKTTLNALDVCTEVSVELADAEGAAPIQVKRAIANVQDAHLRESGYSERTIYRSRAVANELSVALPPWKR